jgi:hypothetical protein
MESIEVGIGRTSWEELRQDRPVGWRKPTSMTLEYFQSMSLELVISRRMVLCRSSHLAHPLIWP